jgi:hypothetical protein
MHNLYENPCFFILFISIFIYYIKINNKEVISDKVIGYDIISYPHDHVKALLSLVNMFFISEAVMTQRQTGWKNPISVITILLGLLIGFTAKTN